METFLMADIFGGFSCIRSAGYLQLRGVSQFMWGTSNCAGYLYLRMVTWIMPGTSDCAGYLRLWGVLPIMRGTLNHAGYLRLCWSHSVCRHMALYYLSYFSPKQKMIFKTWEYVKMNEVVEETSCSITNLPRRGRINFS